MTTFNKTPVVFAAMLTLAIPAFAGDRGAVPSHVWYVVDGLALGEGVHFGSRAYNAYNCVASDQFPGFTWCQRKDQKGRGKQEIFSSNSILHGPDGTTAYVNRSIAPAFLTEREAKSEIDRLSSMFAEKPRLLNMPDRRGLPRGLIAAWGEVDLVPLVDTDAISALAAGESPRIGLLIDFLGDLHKSAKLDLPLYRLSGGPGYVWSTSFDQKGVGHLRFFAVDVSALDAPQGSQEKVATPKQADEPPSAEQEEGDSSGSGFAISKDDVVEALDAPQGSQEKVATPKQAEKPPSAEQEEGESSGSGFAISKDDVVVAEYRGTGIQSTRPFTVDGPWEVQWSSDSSYLSIVLKNAEEEGGFPNIIANQQGSGPGSSYQPQSGTYYFQTNAMGKWHMKVVALKMEQVQKLEPEDFGCTGTREEIVACQEEIGEVEENEPQADLDDYTSQEEWDAQQKQQAPQSPPAPVQVTPEASKDFIGGGVDAVIDGDTIKIGDEIIRLEGIDAPETEQDCFGPGGSYECGKQATKALTALINDMTPDGFVPAGVGCEITGRDRHNRLLGLCSVAKEPVNGRGPGDWVTGELNKKMVEGGWALAFVKYSDRYLPQQKRAETLKFGMWAGTFDEPWDYRRRIAEGQKGDDIVPLLSSRSAGDGKKMETMEPFVTPDGDVIDEYVRSDGVTLVAPGEGTKCSIKGNVSWKGERIYHIPSHRDYGDTKIDTNDGERWFCTEGAARAAGWRRAQR